jgi:hypothetical protein
MRKQFKNAEIEKLYATNARFGDAIAERDDEIERLRADNAALREALTTIAFQSTDMPGAAVGAGDGFYRGYVFSMIVTAARALSGESHE